MVLLGNFQINGSAAQKDKLIGVDTFTDVGSLANVRANTTKILNVYGFTSWSQADITAKFNRAIKYASKVDGLVFLGEEHYKPSRTPQTNPATANGPAYTLEGVTIPAMPAAGEDAYILALLKAWLAMCKRLGKKAWICGSPAVCSDPAIWPYQYGNAGIDYIAKNYNGIFLYHYPTTLSLAQGATCNQQNGNPGKNDAKSYIDFWRGKGFTGSINYILVTKFPDFPGSQDYNVIKADFKNALDAGANIISTYPYANGVYSNSEAVPRMLKIAGELNALPKPPIPPLPIPPIVMTAPTNYDLLLVVAFILYFMLNSTGETA